MSLEDDQDRIAQKMKEAIMASQATQPDVLVFSLRGKEIQELLLNLAETSEKEAEKQTMPKNVRPIRPVHPGHSYSVLGPTPLGTFGGIHMPAPVDESQMQAVVLAHAHERAEAFRANAKTYRFLAAHVEEDRFFRLGVHDLAFL